MKKSLICLGLIMLFMVGCQSTNTMSREDYYKALESNTLNERLKEDWNRLYK